MPHSQEFTEFWKQISPKTKKSLYSESRIVRETPKDIGFAAISQYQWDWTDSERTLFHDLHAVQRERIRIESERGAETQWRSYREEEAERRAGQQQRISKASIFRLRQRLREDQQENLDDLNDKTVSTLKGLMDKANQTLAKHTKKVEMPTPTKNIYEWSERELVRKDYYKFTTHSERVTDESRTDTIAKTREEWIQDIEHLDFTGIDDAPPKDIKVVIVKANAEESWLAMDSDDLGYDDITESPVYIKAEEDHTEYVADNLTDFDITYDATEWQDRFADEEDVEKLAREWIDTLSKKEVNGVINDLQFMTAGYEAEDDKSPILHNLIEEVAEYFTENNPKGLYEKAFDEWRSVNRTIIAYDLISEGRAEFIFDDWSSLRDTGCGNHRGTQRMALLKKQHNGKYREIGYTTFTSHMRYTFGIGSSCIAPSERGKDYFGYLRRGLINYADKLGKKVTTSASASGGDDDPDTDKLERIYSSYGRTSSKGTGVDRLRHDEFFEKEEGLIDADYEGQYLWANRQLKTKLEDQGFGDMEGEKCLLLELGKENRPITGKVLEEMASNCEELDLVDSDVITDFRETMELTDYAGHTGLNEEEII